MASSDDAVLSRLASAVSAADVWAAQPLATKALRDANLAKRLLATLLELASSEPEASETAGAAALLAFQLTLSQNGTEVARYDGQPRVPSDELPVGVLILGFGGASQQALQPHVDFYHRFWPSWRVVVTTRAGMDSAHAAAELEQQRRDVVAALDGCGRLLVHILSNNGHALWVDLLQSQRAAFADRLAGLIFECGACKVSDMQDDSIEAVLLQTIRAGALHHGLTASLRNADAQGRLQATTSGLVRGLVPGFGKSSLGAAEVFAVQRRLEPRAPALVLASGEDLVLPAPGVRSFAESLSERDRVVKLIMLNGPHVQLLQRDSQAFGAAVLAHAALCELDGRLALNQRSLGPNLKMGRVLELQAEEMADDVEIRAGMQFWSDRRLRAYFESGGVDPYEPQLN
jgi:hypothetical protein